MVGLAVICVLGYYLVGGWTGARAWAKHKAAGEADGWQPVWLVRGNRGIGKSRLLREHAEAERGRGPVVVQLSLLADNSADELSEALSRGLAAATGGVAGTGTPFEDATAQLDGLGAKDEAEAATGPPPLPLCRR